MRRTLARILRFLQGRLRGSGLEKIFIVRRFYNRLIDLAREPSLQADVQGHRMTLDTDDALGLSVLGITERVTTALVNRHVNAGQVVLDIGANIGYFTLLFARRVGPSGRVIAFEPSRDNVELLNKNIAVNGYGNVEIVDQAVSDRPGKIALHLSPTSVDHRIFDSGDGRPSREVSVTTIDDYWRAAGRPRIDFVKMDIQGAEGHALDGMSETLRANTSVALVVEFWPYGLRLSGKSPRRVLEQLESLGFALYRVTDSSLEETSASALTEHFNEDEDVFSCNLYCVKGQHDREALLQFSV
jgi:FkbM family methyltransferase